MPEPDCVIKRKHSEENNRPFLKKKKKSRAVRIEFQLQIDLMESHRRATLLKHQLCNLSEKTLSLSSSEILSPFFNLLKSLLPVGE